MPSVLLLNQYYAPDEAATAQMLADLGEGLAASGFEVRAICCDRSYADPSRRYPARETIRGVAIRRARSTGFGRGSKLGRLTDYATFLLGASAAILFGPRPDVVVSLSTPPMIALVGTLLGRLRGARTVFWSMDVYPDVAYELGAIREHSVAGRVVAALAHLTHRLPDHIVALGSTMAARLTDAGARKVTVIHNWADENAITARPPHESALRSEWSWSDRFVVMYSGNMGLAHEFETALLGIAECGLRNAESDQSAAPATAKATLPEVDPHSAFRSPQSAFPALLAFVGGGPRRTEVEMRATELGLTEHSASPIPHSALRIPHSAFGIPHSAEFRPYVDRERLGDSLTAPDVHLVTMRERMPGLLVPSKIYGILAAGRPTIYVGPAEGEIYEILVEGECGIQVSIGDANAFAAAVERYRSDVALREAHGQNARAMFEKSFTRARGIAEFERLLRD
ncbi:MAG: glycosyltransferase family 4 protein [Thermoanaerobaculia bacterium]